MNVVAQDLTGWSSNEAKGKEFDEVFTIVHEKTFEPANFFDKLKKTNEATCFGIHLLLAKDGSTTTIETKAAPIKEAESKIIGTVFVFRDISERKETEERLHLLSEVVSQTSEGIAVLDLDEKVIFVNKAFASMHGYSQEELIGKSVNCFHNPDQMPQVQSAINHMKIHGVFSGEIWHARKDGSVFLGLMHNSVLHDADGNAIAFIGTLRNITDIRANQEALKASHKALEEYSTSLEAKVAERTRDLENSRLELKRYSESLEKTNESLKIIIEGIEEQKKEVEKKITHTINLTIRPILDQLKLQELPDTVKFLLKSLEFSLTNMFSSFGFNIFSNNHLLTPREIRICEMIRSGLSSKQIAEVMGISPQTILVHRKNIRRKLSLGRSGQNLASFLKAHL